MIKEVNKSDVLRSLVDGVKVFRINTKEMIVVDLDNRTMSVIKRDLEKNEYIYFILDEEETPMTYADELSLEHKREYIEKFCDERDRCNETCPLFKVTGAGCYSVESDEIIEKHYDLVREYERGEINENT